MYIAVVGASTAKKSLLSSNLSGLLHQLDGIRVSSLLVIAGPLSAEVISILRQAFPEENNTYIITTKPVASPDKKCISIAGVPVTPRSEYREPVSVSIVGSKGGVGKSTLSLMLALYLYQTSSAEKKNVVIIDADPQAGMSNLFVHKENKDRRVIPITEDGKVRLFTSTFGEYNPAVPDIVGWYLGADWVVIDNGNIPGQTVVAPCMVVVTSASEMVHHNYISVVESLPVSVDATVVNHDPRIVPSDRKEYVRRLQQLSAEPVRTPLHPGQVIELPPLTMRGKPGELIETLTLYLTQDKAVRGALESLVRVIQQRWKEYREDTI